MAQLDLEIEGFEVIFLDFGSFRKVPPEVCGWWDSASQERRGKRITES